MIISLLVYVLIIVGVIVILKKKKGKKENELKEQFQKNLCSHIESFNIQDDYFLANYELIMESCGISREELDKMLESIPALKEEFSSACKKLIALSENNVCFFSREKGREWENSSSYSKERADHDIVKALPAMGDYFEIRNLFHEKLYTDMLTNKIVLKANPLAFGILLTNESDYTSREGYQKILRAFHEFVEMHFDTEVDNIIRKTLNMNSNTDVRNSTNNNVKELLSIAYSDNELLSTFKQIWFKQMQKIGRKYGEAQLDLYRYFESVQKETKEYIDWFFIERLSPWYILLGEETKEECLRVLGLYTSGTYINSGMYSEYIEKHQSEVE